MSEFFQVSRWRPGPLLPPRATSATTKKATATAPWLERIDLCEDLDSAATAPPTEPRSTGGTDHVEPLGAIRKIRPSKEAFA